jgi:hypothetical protein
MFRNSVVPLRGALTMKIGSLHRSLTLTSKEVASNPPFYCSSIRTAIGQKRQSPQIPMGWLAGTE